jgi:protein O-GlcNAc transferase
MNLYWAMANINDYSMYDVYFFRLMNESRAIISKGEYPPVDPFVALHYPFTLKELYAICNSRALNIKSEVERDFPGVKPYTFQPIKNRRIRVGYVSYDLRGHAVGIQFQDVFKYHNKSEFEIFGLNVCVSSKINYRADELYKQMKRDSDHMIDLEDANTKAAADKIYELGLDIIVDIGLYTAGNRMDIFVLKPAPIQAAGVGLATTTGAPWIDYLIADNFVTPPESAPYYSEKLLLMPHSYHPFSHRNFYPSNPPAVPRENLGLPKDKFLYCNHAGATRLEPKTIGYWADIIKRVNNSALVLKRFDERTENIVREFRKRGLFYSEDSSNPKNQIYFMWGAGRDDHIAGKSNCNVFLDVHYYNGHSTTGDMLWAGVPMITFPDVSIASRAAGSFALSAGFPEMIVNSWE